MSKIDLTNLNKIDTDLIMPSTSEENVNLQKQQENKWGSILNNQTFNTLNNNIKLLKNSLVETINTLNNENIVAKNKYINEDTDTLNIGDSNKKLNIISSEFQVNGKNINSLLNNGSGGNNNSDYINDKKYIAFKNKENDFSLPINTTQYNIKSNQVISDDNDNINIGNKQRKLNLQSSDGKLYLNGQEFNGGSNNSNGSNDDKYKEVKLYGKDIFIKFNFHKLDLTEADNDSFDGLEKNFSGKFTSVDPSYIGSERIYLNNGILRREYNMSYKKNNLYFFCKEFKKLNEILFDIKDGKSTGKDVDLLKCIKFKFKLSVKGNKILDEDVILYKVHTNQYFKYNYQGVYKEDVIFVRDGYIVDKNGWYIPFILNTSKFINEKDRKLNLKFGIKLWYNYSLNNPYKIDSSYINGGLFFEFYLLENELLSTYKNIFPFLFPEENYQESGEIKISIQNIEKIYGTDFMYDIGEVQYFR